MIYKKRSFILTILLIIFIQTLLYINNNQKTSFRYFIWSIKEVSIGKLITYSFVSGLLISTILKNTTNINTKRNDRDESESNEDIYEEQNQEDLKSNVEMPPQRDIRDAQPTISVNYRVIKNNADNYSNYDENPSKNTEYQDDWNNEDVDW